MMLKFQPADRQTGLYQISWKQCKENWRCLQRSQACELLLFNKRRFASKFRIVYFRLAKIFILTIMLIVLFTGNNTIDGIDTINILLAVSNNTIHMCTHSIVENRYISQILSIFDNIDIDLQYRYKKSIAFQLFGQKIHKTIQ